MVVVASGNITHSPKLWRNGFKAAKRFTDMYNTAYTCGRVVNDFTPFPSLWSSFSDGFIWDTDDEQGNEIAIELPSEPSRLWIPNLYLTLLDRHELLTGEMLSDKHIYATQRLLSLLRPDMGGLQDPVLSQVKFEPVHEESIQIHHTRGNHWVVSHWIPGDIVRVYDTLYSDVQQDLERQLEEIYVDAPHSRLGEIIYDMPDTQRQRGNKDCGVFATAIAVELCRLGPSDLPELRFYQTKMREHLYECYENECLEEFPQV